MPPIPMELVAAIFFLPLVSLILITFFTRGIPKLSGYLTVTTIGLAFLLSVWTFLTMTGLAKGEHLSGTVNWVVIGDTTLHLGIFVDGLTSIMLLVVTSVSLLVQIYSTAYMHGDPGYSRFYAFMSLFTASMLGLILADNLLMIFIFWELVGVCSYLLIGFWFQKPEAASAAKKAFVVTRFGDLGFLMAILLLFSRTGTLDFQQLFEIVESPEKAAVLGAGVLTWAAIGIFSGAVGKSAQFPLHVWLPDAMEGPTPVSALIHAATMVAAGVYLVARSFPLFEHAPQALFTVAVIGTITAFIAATMGLVMNDFKRVLAYSTISQLGFMMMGLGVCSVVAGIFHLFNHAFFKAMMFLCAGSANHATHTYDIRKMGGLARYMPITFSAMMIGSLSISGIFPFSGFWSKDEILTEALGNGYNVIYIFGLITAFMTAFYMFRLTFVAFLGDYRGGEQPEGGHASSGHGHATPHESPAAMAIPLIVLAIPSIFSGFANINGDFARFLGEAGVVKVHWDVVFTSSTVAILGILTAYLSYVVKVVPVAAIARAFSPIHAFLLNKYAMDDLYNFIVEKVFMGINQLLNLFDQYVVDGAVNGVAGLTTSFGGQVRRLESGRVQGYALVIFVGLVAIVGGFLVFGG
ncbi:MAG: NADH-quinone oxidoreductase subunit L [Dehalococcoidia bacterium]|nr:NADH-quinone oxidoreductase subunit L [Dehalococcoidia bacterium]